MAGKNKEAADVLGMSDEDFMKQASPAPEAADEDGENDQGEEEKDPGAEESADGEGSDDPGSPDDDEPIKEDGEDDDPEDKKSGAEDPGETGSEGSGDADPNPDDQPGKGRERGDGSAPEVDDKSKPEAKAKPKDPKDPKGEAEAEGDDPSDSKSSESAPVDHEAFYNRIMAPFKANGKMIEPRTPEEVITLMQMGANYTRKMQDIQPHRKVLMMLQNNQLLDQDKLSYLIDLDKKDPKAIAKLIKESGVDPLDLDLESDGNGYKPGNHNVSDAEEVFASVLEEVSSTDIGKETLGEVDKWDDASKEALWESPEILKHINDQRESGVYALISEEIDRQRTLNLISANTPFLEAYKKVGNEMAAKAANGSSKPNAATEQPEAQPAKQPVDRRAAVPKSKVKSGDKANAAANTGGGGGKAKKPPVNYLEMSDDEFLKQMENRV